MTRRVGYLIGSLSSDSINRRLARALIALAPPSLAFSEIGYSDLPLYNRDRDADYPAEARRFKQEIEASDALLFVTPEYNRSIPGALKNAIDWGSRPSGTNSFADKPAATIGASGGAIGSAVGQQHLKLVLLNLGTRLLSQPEGYIQLSRDVFDEDGTVHNESTAGFLRGWMEAFAAHIDRNLVH